MVDEIAAAPATPMEVPHAVAAVEGLTRRMGRDLRRLVDGFAPGLRGSSGRLLALIGEGGTRPSVLADGALISKQAVGQRLREMEDVGLVVLLPDPDDGRAVLARRTAEGDEILRRLNAAIADLEAEWAAVAGAERYAIFRNVLDELASPHLSAAVRTRSDPPPR